MFLYHYFEKERGPFLSLSSLPDEEAVEIHENLESNNNIFARRNFDRKYIQNRRMVEDWLHEEFMRKGGKPKERKPQYMTLGECHHCKSWFDCADFIKIPLNEFDINTISFTYGDSFPTFFAPQFGDKSEYRLNIYMNNEIWDIIEKHGFPQDAWTEKTPHYAPSYVEVQVWNYTPLEKYKLLHIPSHSQIL